MVVYLDGLLYVQVQVLWVWKVTLPKHDYGLKDMLKVICNVGILKLLHTKYIVLYYNII